MRDCFFYTSFLLTITSAYYARMFCYFSLLIHPDYIGDQINFTVNYSAPADINLILPVLKDSLMKNIEILSGPVLTVRRAGMDW